MKETNLYTVTVPVFIKSLEALSGVLKKAEAHAKERSTPKRDFADALLNDRIVFDQFPLIRQVQIATDNAKNSLKRIGGIDVPAFDDTEKTFDELQQRIAKTIEILKSAPEDAIKGKEEVSVSLPYWEGKTLTGSEYVLQYLIPNFFFHVTTAYAIVRKNGIVVGKGDFTGPLPLK